jgi:hypothetical protein
MESEQSNGSNPKKPVGAPKGSANHFQHGAYSLLAMRTKGRPNGNTKLGRAFRAREKEYLRDMGSDDKTLSLAQRQLANDNVWCDFILSTVDIQLSGKRQLTRKGRPHPLIDLRMRIAAHRRDNYRLCGIKRVPKLLSLQSILEGDDKPEGGNGAGEP